MTRRRRWRGILRAVLLGLAVAAPDSPIRAGETQTELNQQAGAALGAAEAELKRVFGELGAGATDDAEAREKLRRAQSAWETYRDAQLQALWPSPDPAAYGTVHPMCVAIAKAELTRARTRELRAMLEPREGDACAPFGPSAGAAMAYSPDGDVRASAICVERPENNGCLNLTPTTVAVYGSASTIEPVYAASVIGGQAVCFFVGTGEIGRSDYVVRASSKDGCWAKAAAPVRCFSEDHRVTARTGEVVKLNVWPHARNDGCAWEVLPRGVTPSAHGGR